MKKAPVIRMNLPLRNSRIKLPLGQVFWREVGQGPVLIFLHGSWNDGTQWLSVIDHLSQDYHCFVPDLLGFGESERPKVHYSIQLQVECLLAYFKALHISEVYLIGHSVGGWVAASYALRYFEQVKGLILIAPEGVQTEGQGEIWRKERWLVGNPPIAYYLLRSILPLARLLGRHKPIEQALLLRQQLNRSTTACKLLFGRRRAEIQAELLQDRLVSLQVPTLILQGGNDGNNAIAQSQTYAHNINQAQLQMIEHGGHDLPETLASLVAQSIGEFVNSH
jgi:pimeloyl-ACP methyl ester carboxylesterase